ncbi:MAG: hypothetical protein GY943_25005 [Chloroflexi bacterium]|nr:hypothetical protein [Chloroflexota bacterium]
MDTYQLDFAIPGKTPDEWVIQTALTGLTSRDMFPSPDGQKLALAQYQDTNGDGYVPSPRGGDAYDVFLYTIADGSLVGLTDNQFSSYPEVNWLPDSQSFTYPIHHDIWQVDIENPSQQILLTNLDNRIFGHVWSLNGEFLAFNTQGTNGPSPPELDRLYIYKASTGEVVSVFENMPITLEMRWSADNNWLAIAPGQNSGLYLINAQTFEVLEVIERGSGRIKNDWSPDGHWLLYVEDVSTIELWESSTKNSFDFIQEPYAFSQFVWAPNSSELAFTMWDEEKISLVVANRESGEMRTLYIVDSVDKSERPYGLESISEMQLLTWSPDSQWILFFAEQEEGIGLYVINREGNEAYPILETGVRSFFHYWIANLETDRTRQVVWLPDSIR